MDEIPIYAVYAVEMILRQNGSWRAARMPFTVTFPPKRREFLVTAGYPASEIKLRNPMIVGLAAVCFDFGHRKTLITLWRPRHNDCQWREVDLRRNAGELTKAR